MNNEILQNIKGGELILFLGAGASYGCKTATKQPVPMAGDFASQMASAAGLPYEDEPLDQVYEAARGKLGVRLDALLNISFAHVTPSIDYDRLASYPWRRIYTLNIDDGLDKSLIRHSPQKVNKLGAADQIVDRDAFFETVEYIKLNGTIDRLKDGIIFSPSEYARATASHLPWYSQCASDFVRSPILFIGTQLNEPLLKFHIERYQLLNAESSGISYLICPNATHIQIESLKRYNIQYIKGTLQQFVQWLTAAIPAPPKPIEIARANIPQLNALLSENNPTAFVNLFDHITVVKRDRMPAAGSTGTSNTIRDFYKGFKPTWIDIVEGIPAELEILNQSVKRIREIDFSSKRLIPFLGPAGSGKTTLLMQLCWRLSNMAGWDVFFIDAEPNSLLSTLEAIEKSSPAARVLVALDNLEFHTDSLQFALASKRLTKTLLIGAEREGIWNRRGKHVLRDLYHPATYVRDFSETDASKILERLQKYGSWTRLGKMKESDRLRELLNRSKKQLLIALLEATLGRGFEKIIEDEYARIGSQDERLFLVTVALITDRRREAPISLIDRALDKMSILRRATAFASDLAGIVHQFNNTLTARHPVYAKYLIDRVIDPSLAAKSINGLLQAFADYQAPVIQHIKKSEAALYKSLINHKFLFEVLKGNREKIIQTYSDLEKRFERDGLFWLQYGLSLRDFDLHADALDKMRIACLAYPMPHTEHALAQQMLLVALEGTDSAIALGLAEEAKQLLEKLDDVIESDDTYPIVTLAEGMTDILRVHGSVADARLTAKKYATALERRARQNPEHIRLQAAYERLFRYASVGIWTPTAPGR
jgi:hypothetical protein